MVTILFGSGAYHLAQKIKGKKVEVREFPDGELYVRIPEGEKEKVVYIQSGFPEQNKKLIESFLTIDACYDLGAKEVVVVMLYLPYSRQDKRFLAREAISINTILRIFEKIGVKKLVTVNTHFLKGTERFRFGKLEVINIDASSNLVNYVMKNYPKATIVAPDKGAEYIASKAKKYLLLQKVRGDYSTKKGILEREVKTITGNLTDVEEAFIVDDMISTGGTIVKSVEFLRKNNVKVVGVGCVHGLFIRDAAQKIRKLGISNIVATDTIKTEFGKISIKDQLERVLSNL